MSSLRILFHGLLGTVVVTAGLAAQQPLDTVGPLEKQSNPITPENPIPRRTFSVAAAYPAEALGTDAMAIVALVATLDSTGRVVEIRKLREPVVMAATGSPATPTALRIAGEAFLRNAAAALRQWQYELPAKAPISFPVTFTFKPGADAAAVQSTTGVTGSVAGGVTGGITGGVSGGVPGALGAVRVGGSIKAPTLLKRVAPVYPLIAMSARVQGIVILEATISVDGRVIDAKVLRSVPLLDQAAIDAVRQWEYTPTLLNGAPVPVIMTVTVTFSLPELPSA
jgi:TonB family protein